MSNYAPTYTFFGDLQVDDAGANAKSVARRGDVAGLSYIKSIAPSSSSMLSVSAGGALSVDSLLVTNVTVNTDKATLAAWVAAGIPATMKEGDVLILTQPNPEETYICKNSSPAAVGDFARLNDSIAWNFTNGVT